MKLEKLYNLKKVSVCLKRLSLDRQNNRLDLKDVNVIEKLSDRKAIQPSSQNEKKLFQTASQPTARKQKFVSKNKDQNKDRQKQDYNRCM